MLVLLGGDDDKKINTCEEGQARWYVTNHISSDATLVLTRVFLFYLFNDDIWLFAQDSSGAVAASASLACCGIVVSVASDTGCGVCGLL